MRQSNIIVFSIVIVSLASSGCVSISKYTPPKATAGIEEERPILQGGIGKEQPKIKVDVELLERPDFSKFSAPRTPDTAVEGNAGNLEGGVLMLRKNFQAQAGRTEQPVAVEQKPNVWWRGMQEEQNQASAPAVIEKRPATANENLITKYRVKKGQTLADIAGLKEIYGDAKKWRRIYKANKDRIKNPDKIYAGQVLKIPRE